MCTEELSERMVQEARPAAPPIPAMSPGRDGTEEEAKTQVSMEEYTLSTECGVR